MLAFLALAIFQAVTSVITNNIPISDYISHYGSSEKDAIDLLSREPKDQGRHGDVKNAIITTWYVSFGHILQ